MNASTPLIAQDPVVGLAAVGGPFGMALVAAMEGAFVFGGLSTPAGAARF
ncbi:MULTISPECIES: hypothetical protein [Variovorax]|jgi:hypothetical protein|nr:MULTISPECIES: hypothetical protein [Variovorax]MBN8758195.1 hypothetical protein [Variovorax sp.]UKI07735.1 hypothetical protein L3V85_33920 [Variovorax paradoxus]